MRLVRPLRNLGMLAALAASLLFPRGESLAGPRDASPEGPELAQSTLPAEAEGEGSPQFSTPTEEPPPGVEVESFPAGSKGPDSGAPGYCVSVPDRQEVRDIVAEFTGPQRATFVAALRRSGRYLSMIRRILAEEGLPEEIGYLAMVESHFRPDARSPSGAVGLWQFIESTARHYGLRVDAWADERLDPEAATRAAVRHMADLYARFGDWNLAVAAYNAGPGGVGRALETYGTDSFWDLFARKGLRRETCRYVMKFLAALAIAADPGAHGLGGEALDDPLAYDTVWVDSPIDVTTIARLLAETPRTLRELNPALLRDRTPPDAGFYPVRVPQGRGDVTARAIARLPRDQRLAFIRHKVLRGETLFGIARRYGVKAHEIAEASRLGGRRALRAGEGLLIPRTLKSGNPAPDTTVTEVVHVVRQGDTVWGISRRYGVDPAELLRLNNRKSGEIRPGERLVVSGERGVDPG